MDPGWFVLFLFMLIEAALVLLLVMPMPSNQVRGSIVGAIVTTWEKNVAIRYVAMGVLAIDVLYFWHVIDALSMPFYAFGLFEDAFLNCEMRSLAFERERNAYITGTSIFLFLVLRRLVDIQAKLFQSRGEAKAAGMGIPMGAPVQHRAHYE